MPLFPHEPERLAESSKAIHENALRTLGAWPGRTRPGQAFASVAEALGALEASLHNLRSIVARLGIASAEKPAIEELAQAAVDLATLSTLLVMECGLAVAAKHRSSTVNALLRSTSRDVAES